MNYAEAVNYLYGLGHETLAMKLGLETVRALAEAWGEPQRRFPAVHIAGTNGKGSTAALLDAMARAAGRYTGLYTSPHLVEITERIRIDGREIAPDEFARLATEVRAVGERLTAEGRLPALPTFFEQVTMSAFLYFAERQVDLAVLEVGLGGRLDATNICAPLVTAITPVGLDHQQILGDTLAAIAAEKAGIVKPGVPVVVAPQPPEAMHAIAARCAALNAPLVQATESEIIRVEAAGGTDGLAAAGFHHCVFRTARAEYEARLSLRGRHQVINALTAIHLAEQLQLPPAAIVAGLGNAHWPGRLEVIQGDADTVPLLLDGAHNGDGARALRAFLAEYCAARPPVLIFGAMSDKAIAEMAATLFPLAALIIAAPIANPRAVAPQVIAELAARCERPALVAADATEALALARQHSAPPDVICVCGSLYLIGEFKRLLAAV